MRGVTDRVTCLVLFHSLSWPVIIIRLLVGDAEFHHHFRLDCELCIRVVSVFVITTMLLSLLPLLFVLVFTAAEIDQHQERIKQTLERGLDKTDDLIKKLMTRWQIKEYPNFLKSAAMPKSSWDIMKVKFQSKILEGLLSPEGTVQFVMSFTGSSVTAGHDTVFNQSFSELSGKMMNEVLPEFNVRAVSRNVALGNNPCLPYDVCVSTFAGKDSDVVHWEQSFNCDGRDTRFKPVFETFVRQIMSFQNNAVVVFSNSVTPNWKNDACKDKKSKPQMTEEDNELLLALESNPTKIVSELNKKEFRAWPAMSDMLENYKAAGFQFFSHEHYEKYKCHGPYVPSWGCCSASWHPSILGHELRASHHVFFWVLILRDAIQFLQKSLSTSTANDLLKTMKKHLKAEMKYSTSEKLYNSKYPDSMKCYTSFEPHADRSMSLSNLVLPSNDGSPGFKTSIFEQLSEPRILDKARKMGYQDFKYIYYGNKDSGVISFHIEVTTLGNAFLCQPPGNWGKLPNGFSNLWECNTEVYISPLAEEASSFQFDKSKAKRVNYTQKETKNSQAWLCVDFDEPLPLGSHALTVVPTTNQMIGIAFLLIP